MTFEYKDFHRNIDEQELLSDLVRVHKIVSENGHKLTSRSYNELGKFTSGTISTRFGSWNNGLTKAGLKVVEEKNVSEIKLFENLKRVWNYKSAQPVFRDMNNPPSDYAASTYAERFGSWKNALKSFVNFINSDEFVKDAKINESSLQQAKKIIKPKKRTSRNISERLRFRILLRDGFRCQTCGGSPVKEAGIDLDVDHIIPWSKGGETIPENLQTKCKRCNLGKGNAFNK
jgi:hypothetical protein